METLEICHSQILSHEESDCLSKDRDSHNRRSYNLSVITLVVTVILAVANFAYQAWKDHGNKTSSDERLAKIETAIRLLTGATAPQLQKAIDDSLASALASPAQAKDKAAFVGTVLNQLAAASVALPSESIAKTGIQLNDLSLANKSVPEVWSATAEFISYRSRLKSGWQDITLPPCSGQKIQMKGYRETLQGKLMTVYHDPVEFHSCTIVLDSIGSTYTLAQALQFSNVICNSCIITYRGGEINLQGPGNHPPVGTIFFHDCYFMFDTSAVPSSPVRRLTRDLLLANSQVVQFDTSTQQGE